MERISNKDQIIISFFHLCKDAKAKDNRHFDFLNNNSINSKDFNDISEIEIKIEPLESLKQNINSVIKLQGEIIRKKNTFVSIGKINKFNCSCIYSKKLYSFSIKLENTNVFTNKTHKFSSKKNITGIELLKMQKISLFNVGKNLICEIFRKEELNNYQIQINYQKINENIQDSSKFIELLKDTEKVISIIELIFNKELLLSEAKDSLSK